MNEWIKFTDKKPEIEKDILVYFGNYNGCIMDVYTYLGDYFERGVDIYDNCRGDLEDFEDGGATHWMKLPEPPVAE